MLVKEYLKLKKAKKRNKFGAIKCTHDGLNFDSLAEGNYYLILRDRLKKQEIGDLQIHPFFHVQINGKKICKVVLDFSYYDNKLCKEVFVDVKGFATRVSRLKKKMVEAQFGIQVDWVDSGGNLV